MHTRGVFPVSSNVTGSLTPDGAVIVRQYLIPRNPESRLYKLHKEANPDDTSGLIPAFGIMGAFLDKPLTTKSNESGHSGDLDYGVAAMQGWRVEMEDAHTIRVGDGLPPVWNTWSFFALFDGHAGKKVAEYCSGNLFQSIWNTAQMQQLAQCLPLAKLETNHLQLVLDGMKQGFLNLDDQMRRIPELFGENNRSGSTAVCAIISPSHLFLANLGDSRAMVGRNGELHFVTEDHKPYLPKERDRIVNAGGSVMIQRVNGSLAVSRALGDYEYKCTTAFGPCQQMVSPEPDVHVIERGTQSGKDEFLLLACDGVFDVMNNGELCEFVRNRLKITDRLELICNQILDSCLSKGSKDNMSVILVRFPNASEAEDGARKDIERELIEAQLREQISDMVNAVDCPRSLDSVFVDNVTRLLMDQKSSLLPPDMEVQDIRPMVESVLESVRENSIPPNDAGGKM